MKIILFSPDIPQNVGNIARTAAITGSQLTLVRPLSFPISDKQMKRAGLDYWEHVTIEIVDHLEEALRSNYAFFSTKASRLYTERSYSQDDCLIFGSESSGLPKWVHEKYADYFYTIPMRPQVRSLNLSNAVAIVTYEALRQQQFTGLHEPSCAENLSLLDPQRA